MNKNLKFELINYFDVWGNERDGYEVNNLCKDGIVELKEDYEKQDILNELFAMDFLNRDSTLEDYEIWDDGEMIEIFAKNGYPIGRLELLRR